MDPRETSSSLRSLVARAFRGPALALVLLAGAAVLLSFFEPGLWLHPYVRGSFRVLTIVFVFWGLYAIAGLVPLWERILHLGATEEEKAHRALLVPILSWTTRLFLAFVGAGMVLQEFGYRIDTLVAGLGLGGLAVSLAARDTLANYFGGIVLIGERTFAVGDWIEFGDVSGTVETMNFRSTKIRAQDDSLITVPNAVLAQANIKNWGRVRHRMVRYTLSLPTTLAASEVRAFLAELEELLRRDPNVLEDRILGVESLDGGRIAVHVRFYVRTADYSQWFAYRSEHFLVLGELLRKYGVSAQPPLQEVLLTEGTQSPSSGGTSSTPGEA
ncbi:MAG: Small-conductance mechanosensitive channel [Brockia lithotrophica]|uniref:Small-conductance mechanosensitive channel n=1 Tax=Brockia lithotrophica TaxID=933949 RepID=A0A2T5GAA7_9BACL|nr:mechanosensitive ion channel [Brockia lithotrophica]PTQ53121.1 MAG: Small-conductance mechanosensitive channel [Brockia lithotrophica]